MKTILFNLTVHLFIIFYFTAAANAAALYQNDNQSAEFIRTINRSASTEIDAAYYNPAGLSMLKDNGLFIYFSNQVISQTREVRDSSNDIVQHVGSGSSVTYTGEASTLIYPTGYIVYKNDGRAFYCHLSIVGAGVAADFDNGLPGFDSMSIMSAKGTLAGLYGESLTDYKSDNSFDVRAVMYGITAGGSYSLSKKISVALGIRHIIAVQDSHLSMRFKSILGNSGTTLSDIRTDYGYFTDVDIESQATGRCNGIIAGIDFVPVSTVNIGLKCEYYSTLELENRKPERYIAPVNLSGLLETQFGEGIKIKKTLPASFSMGISWMALARLKIESSFSYFFNRVTDWGTDSSGESISEKFNNGFGFGLALEYALFPRLRTSAGGTWSVSGRTREVRSEGEFDPPCLTIGCGATCTFSSDIELTVAGMRVFFHELQGTAMSDDQAVSIPSTWNFAIGATYRVL